ncbi:MAG TPA: hypothetical protein VOA41_21085 [Candidatus Dormibacteraeota bacterium]|nr:hypothetical protein [Candidatus Dormibacteraeota bacterium]
MVALETEPDEVVESGLTVGVGFRWGEKMVDSPGLEPGTHGL